MEDQSIVESGVKQGEMRGWSQMGQQPLPVAHPQLGEGRGTDQELSAP